jgi:hypothetical protein
MVNTLFADCAREIGIKEESVLVGRSCINRSFFSELLK